MSIYRVPSDKIVREDLQEVTEKVDRIPYATNFAIDSIRAALKELEGVVIRRTGGRVDGVLGTKFLQAGEVTVGTDPGGTQKFRAESLKAGSAAFDLSLIHI